MATKGKKLPLIGLENALDPIERILADITAAHGLDNTAKIAVDKAVKDTKEARAGRTNTRETIYSHLAATAIANTYTVEHCAAAVERFAATGNDDATMKTYRSFANDCVLVMHPKVRERWADIMAMATSVFALDNATEYMGAAGEGRRRIQYAMRLAGAAKANKLPVGYENNDPKKILQAAKDTAGQSAELAKAALHKAKGALRSIQAAMDLLGGNMALATIKASIEALDVSKLAPAIVPAPGNGLGVVTPPTVDTSAAEAVTTKGKKKPVLAPTSASPAPAPAAAPATNTIAQADIDALLANPLFSPTQIMQVMARLGK